MMDGIGGINPYQQNNYQMQNYQQQNYNQNGGGAAAAASAGPGGASASASASGGSAAAAASAGPGGASASASAGGGVGGPQGMDRTQMDPETRLENAGDQFGQALQGLNPKEKADMRKLKEMVTKWAEQMEKQGQPVDKASMFAMVAMLYANQGLQQNPGNSGLQNLFGAGGNFINETNNVVQMDQQRQGMGGLYQ
ncbi:MAG: hypothetical protein AB2L14_34795 [Candidatus Xenobiia bacterium LiM19]